MVQNNSFLTTLKKSEKIKLSLFEKPVNNYDIIKIYSNFANSVEENLTSLIINNKHNEKLVNFLLVEKVKIVTFFQKTLKELNSNKTSSTKNYTIFTAIKKFFKLR